MALGGCFTCLKYLMFVFNFIFWLIGAGLLALGIWSKVSETSLADVIKDDETASNLSYLAWGIIVIGAVVFVVGFLGCCGAIKESQCMLATFFIFLFVIFAALLAVGIYAYVKFDEDDVEKKLDKEFRELIEEYKLKGDNETRVKLETISEELHCCGAESYKDLGDTRAKEICEDDYEEQKGCTKATMDFLKGSVVIVFAVVLAMAVIMLLGMIFSMLLCCAIREVE